MKPTRGAVSEPSRDDVRAALAAIGADELREVVRENPLQGDVGQAAESLAQAPGLGWSNGEHPGHLIFPLLQTLLGANAASRQTIAFPDGGMDIEELDLLISDAHDEPRLATPEVDDILRDAGVEAISDAEARQVVLAATRAEVRLGGVIDQKRRQHYGHAASLVAACVACDGSPETARWAATLRGKHRRFPAFCAALDRRMRSG